MRTLRQYLSAVLEQTAVSIPLEKRKYGVSVAIIADKRLVTTATFVMAVAAIDPAPGTALTVIGAVEEESAAEAKQEKEPETSP